MVTLDDFCGWLRLGWQWLQFEFFGRGGRQFFDVAEERDELPDLSVVQRFVPGGHAGPADAVLNDVEVLILGHVWRVFEKDRYRRIEGAGEDAVLIGRQPVTTGAMIHI